MGVMEVALTPPGGCVAPVWLRLDCSPSLISVSQSLCQSPLGRSWVRLVTVLPPQSPSCPLRLSVPLLGTCSLKGKLDGSVLFLHHVPSLMGVINPHFTLFIHVWTLRPPDLLLSLSLSSQMPDPFSRLLDLWCYTQLLSGPTDLLSTVLSPHSWVWGLSSLVQFPQGLLTLWSGSLQWALSLP